MQINTGNVAQGTPIPENTGTYTIGEADSKGYIETIGGDCAANGTVTVAKGDNKVCTITNDFPFFTVTVTKVMNNIHGGNNVVGDFNLSVGPYAVTSGVPKKVAVGTYLVNESGVGGYDGEFIGDCNTNTQLLTGANGETKACTITNTDIEPNITLIKKVVGGTALPSDFIMHIDTSNVVNGGSKLVTSNSPHTISEDQKPGYTGAITGDAKCPTTLGGAVTLDEGVAITCTITNTFTP